MDDYALILAPQSPLVKLLSHYSTRFNRKGNNFIEKVKDLRHIHYLTSLVEEYISVYEKCIHFKPFTLERVFNYASKIDDHSYWPQKLINLFIKRVSVAKSIPDDKDLEYLYENYYEKLDEDWDLSRRITPRSLTATVSTLLDMNLLGNGRILYVHLTNEIVYYYEGDFFYFDGLITHIPDDTSVSMF